MKREIRAVHKFTLRSVKLYYEDIEEAKRQNSAMRDFEYV